MKLNNRGFAISTIMYLILVLAIILMSSTLFILSGRKLMVDKQKKEVLEEVYLNEFSGIEVLCNVVSGNKNTIGSEYICDLGDGPRTFFLLEDGDTTSLTKWDGYSYIDELSLKGTAGRGEVALIMSENITENGVTSWISEQEWSNLGGIVTEQMLNDGGWCQYDSHCLTNEFGSKTANEYIASKTSSWQNVKVTLPTYNQLDNIGCTNSSTCPSWAQTDDSYGYWLASAVHGNYDHVWIVHGYSYEMSEGVLYGYYDVRPVITIYKNQLDA